MYFSERDKHGTFSKLLMKYYMSEGVAVKHGLFVGSLDCDTDKFVSSEIKNF